MCENNEVYTEERKQQTLAFAKELAEKQLNFKGEKVKSIYNELFEEED